MNDRVFWEGQADQPPADPNLGSLVDWLLPIEEALRERLTPGAHVLDLGCGPGRLLAPMATKYDQARFYGVDRSARALDLARLVVPDNVQLVLSGRTIPAGAVLFDAGWCVLLFQHLTPTAVDVYLRNVAECFAPGGTFRIQVVSADAPTPVAYGPYDWHYPSTWIRERAEGHGLTVAAVEPGVLWEEFTWFTLVHP